jgi:hypothetical protein
MPNGTHARWQERLALNESRFRAVNEAIERGLSSRDQLGSYVCECGRLGCNEIVELSYEEYESVRRSPRQFLLLDGHQLPIDETVERHAGYVIVAKLGRGAAVAAAEDPRDAPPAAGTR